MASVGRWANRPTSVQRSWRECCQSIDVHRFDCREAPPEKRGKGPFGPTTAPTAAELVAKLRPRLIIDEPRPGVLRVRELL